jgi:hypothetical protein
MAELFSTTLFADANLKSYYRLTGNSNDAKGSNNGTDTSVSYGATFGKYGQGASFNGSTSKITMSAPMVVSNNFSLCGWVYINTFAQAGTFWGIGGTGSNLGYFCCVGGATTDSAGSHLVINFPGVGWVDTGFVLTVTTWTHIAMIRSGGTTQCYVNGVAQGSSTGSAPQAPNGSAALGVTSTAGSTSSFLNGYLDEPAFFDKALSTTELATLMRESGGFFGAL